MTRALGFDAWTVDCIPILGEGTNCPEPAGPDFDFGQAPALFTVRDGSKSRDVVGAGQKSGQYWTLDPGTGAVQWVTQAGPGGTAGGLQWGSAVDGQRVYTANANSQGRRRHLLSCHRYGVSTVGPGIGFQRAVDIAA